MEAQSGPSGPPVPTLVGAEFLRGGWGIKLPSKGLREASPRQPTFKTLPTFMQLSRCGGLLWSSYLLLADRSCENAHASLL